jgi:DnaA family protein
MSTQLTLNIRLRDDATFTNFTAGANQNLLNYLTTIKKNSSGEKIIYLWGNQGSGRSHLLQAYCHLAHENGLVAMYVPLEDQQKFAPTIFEDSENLDVLCLDDVNAIAGNIEWEEALFHCYNRIQTTSTQLIVTASAAPKFISWKLPDLQSRLSAAVIFQVQELTDNEKLAALQHRAKLRGMTLTKPVAEFLLNHYHRDTKNLFAALEKLDRASLAEKRKLTIPFVREVLMN